MPTPRPGTSAGSTACRVCSRSCAAVAHELAAAAYAIKAARAAAPKGEGERAGRLECWWQRDQLPEAIRELVLDDQRVRHDLCWSVFASSERIAGPLVWVGPRRLLPDLGEGQ